MDQNLSFKLDPSYIAKARSLYNMQQPPSGLSTLVYVRTYSRNIYDDNKNYTRNESKFDTYLRCINGIYTLAKDCFPSSKKWDEKFWQQDAFIMMKLFIQRKISPPGRGLWNLGTPLVHSKQIGMALFNCAFITSKNIDVVGAEFFCFIMYGLMVGSGVGFDDGGHDKINVYAPVPSNFKPCASVKPLCEFIETLVPLSRKITPTNKKYLDKEIKYMKRISIYHPNQYEIFVVPDDRAGWIEALRRLLNSYLKKQYIVLFDYSKIRPKGEYLITSGGRASGPQPLAEALSIIRYLLNKRINCTLDAVTIVDISNIIGMMVVAGNIRRSSQIFCFQNAELADIKKMYTKTKGPNGRYYYNIRVKGNAYSSITIKSQTRGQTEIESDPDLIQFTRDVSGNITNIRTCYEIIKNDDCTLTIWDDNQDTPDPDRPKNIMTLDDCVHNIEFLPYGKYRYRTMTEAWSGNSNNSLIIDNNWTDEEYGKVLDKILPIVDETSEPGIFNIELARHLGRVIDGWGDHDLEVDGLNPCGETTLKGMSKSTENDNPYSAGGELCCLSEIIMSNITSIEEFCKACYYATFLAKMMCTVPLEWKASNEIQHKHYRIGVSQTGIMQHLAITGHKLPEYAIWCDRGYKAVRAADDKISSLFNLPKSIKVTVVKPAGTISLENDTTSGISGPISQYSIRRVRVSKDATHILECLEQHGYPIEDDVTASATTSVVEFPLRYNDNIVTKKSATLLFQFQLIKIIQTYWSDNAVSCTIVYKDGELPLLKKYLIKYRGYIKCASFSKYYDVSNSQYKQLPQEEITKKEYDERMSRITPFRDVDMLPKSFTVEEEIDNMCDGEKCKSAV